MDCNASGGLTERTRGIANGLYSLGSRENYMFLGMPVIATSTLEKGKVIEPGNGGLRGDTVEDFCFGLKVISWKKALV